MPMHDSLTAHAVATVTVYTVDPHCLGSSPKRIRNHPKCIMKQIVKYVAKTVGKTFSHMQSAALKMLRKMLPCRHGQNFQTKLSEEFYTRTKIFCPRIIFSGTKIPVTVQM